MRVGLFALLVSSLFLVKGLEISSEFTSSDQKRHTKETNTKIVSLKVDEISNGFKIDPVTSIEPDMKVFDPQIARNPINDAKVGEISTNTRKGDPYPNYDPNLSAYGNEMKNANPGNILNPNNNNPDNYTPYDQMIPIDVTKVLSSNSKDNNEMGMNIKKTSAEELITDPTFEKTLEKEIKDSTSIPYNQVATLDGEKNKLDSSKGNNANVKSSNNEETIQTETINDLPYRIIPSRIGKPLFSANIGEDADKETSNQSSKIKTIPESEGERVLLWIAVISLLFGLALLVIFGVRGCMKNNDHQNYQTIPLTTNIKETV